MRIPAVICPGCSDRTGGGCWDLAGRWDCSDVMCSGVLVSFDAVAPVRLIDVILMLDVDLVSVRTVLAECST